MKIIKTTTALLLFICLLTAGFVYSHSDATGIVKQRMDAMKDMSDKSKIVNGMLKGKTEFNSAAVADAADSFILHGTEMSELFPDTDMSRTGSKTEALPKIWNDWEDFEKRVLEFVELSQTLKETVEATDDVGTLKKAFFNTAKSCSGCHKQFRKPKD